ncbi:MAG: STAS domain-containing protein [Deltaproteobacteria bacterium]|nr:STAS domain-containing protein [Deltaproteobacteria bacterium]
MENFEVAREDRSNVSILRLRGFLDAHTAPNFEQAIQELIEEDRFKIIVSMSDLNYISSAGLGVFMGFIEEIRENNGDIKLSNMTDKVYKVFDLLGFPALYQIFKEEAEAEKEYNK